MVPVSRTSVTLEMLYKEIIELKSIVNKPRWGFSGDRRMRYVFCQLTNGNKDGWYELIQTGDKKEAQTLPPIYWGMPYNIDFKEVERQGEKIKFRLWMLAEDDLGEELTIFEAGKDTFFAKTMMAAIASLSVHDLQRPLRLKSYTKQIQAGCNRGSKTLGVYPSFGDGDENRIDAPWKNSDNWRQIARQAIDNIRAASGYTPSDERQPNQAA